MISEQKIKGKKTGGVYDGHVLWLEIPSIGMR